MSSDIVERLIDAVTAALGYGEDARAAARDASRPKVSKILAEGLVRDDGLDGALFRFWCQQASANPGDLARRIAHCVQPEQYREALIGAARAARINLPDDVLPFRVRPADDLLAGRFRGAIRKHCAGAGDFAVRAAADDCVAVVKAPDSLPASARAS